MVKSSGAYRWSSYRINALGKQDKLVKPHPLYQALGKARKQRKDVYRTLFKAHIEADVLTEIRDAWQTGTPFGNEHFKEKIERKLQCKAGQARRGRPKKGSDPRLS